MKKQVKNLIADIKHDIAYQKEMLKHFEDKCPLGWTMHVKSIRKTLKLLMEDLRYYSTHYKETDYINIGFITPEEIKSI